MDTTALWKYLENLGIYDLRTLGRLSGVKSPTTLLRQELIESIISVLTGHTQKSLKTKVGRPPIICEGRSAHFDGILKTAISLLSEKEGSGTVTPQQKKESDKKFDSPLHTELMSLIIRAQKAKGLSDLEIIKEFINTFALMKNL